jgi:serine/threonine protein phosphatase PrpC
MFKLWRRWGRKPAPAPPQPAPATAVAILPASAEAAPLDPPSGEMPQADSPPYTVVASLLTDVGCHRTTNEDSLRYIKPSDADLLAKKGVLAIVADGMGGHSAGEVASNIAVQVISRVYYESAGDAPASLAAAFRAANREIYDTSHRDTALKGMGTTCTALVLQNGLAFSAHVGDSRLYLVRDEAIYLMSEDHSAVMELVRQGILSLEQARHHADKNVILRALGTAPEVSVSSWGQPFPVRAGDRFVLCSDGLYDLVRDEEIRRAVVSLEPHRACARLVALAKARGGYDNIAVGLLSLQPVGERDEEVPETREMETPVTRDGKVPRLRAERRGEGVER